MVKQISKSLILILFAEKLAGGAEGSALCIKAQSKEYGLTRARKALKTGGDADNISS